MLRRSNEGQKLIKFDFIKSRSVYILSGTFLLLIILTMVIQVPSFLIDILMAISLISGLLILFSNIYLKKNAIFSHFPMIVFISLLFRLSVNIICSNRLLKYGDKFDGMIVKVLGGSVVSSQDYSGLSVGIIIFIILTIMHLFIMNAIATKMCGFASRFKVYLTPNIELSIDHDLNNGLIKEDEAIRRTNEIKKESAFYGNMIGLSRSLQIEVIVGILIVIINTTGKLDVGMILKNKSLDIALSNYISLIIGSGIVNILPALIISIAISYTVSRTINN